MREAKHGPSIKYTDAGDACQLSGVADLLRNPDCCRILEIEARRDGIDLAFCPLDVTPASAATARCRNRRMLVSCLG